MDATMISLVLLVAFLGADTHPLVSISLLAALRIPRTAGRPLVGINFAAELLSAQSWPSSRFLCSFWFLHLFHPL